MNIEKMLSYQKVDGQLRKIMSTLVKSEESQKGKKLNAFLKDAEEKLKKMDRRAEELNAQIAKLKANYQQSIKNFAELEEGVEHAIDKDELNYLTKKLAELSKTIANIEKDLFTCKKEMDDMAKKYDEIRSQLPNAKAQYKECREKMEQSKKAVEPQVNQLKTQLAELEKDIEANMLEVYQKRKQTVYPVFVELNGGNCGGCQMELIPSERNKLDEKGYIVCEHCSRLIYKK